MESEKGIGLAANQIGVSVSVFVLGIEGVKEAYVNPEILSAESPIDYQEGCLSIPGTSGVTKRFNKLTLRWTKPESDSLSSNVVQTFEGLKAIAIQHEMDHLNGKLYIDQFGPLKKSMTVQKHLKYMKLRSK